MSILVWLVLGLIASKIANKSGDGHILDIVLGVIGAVVGGFVSNRFGEAGVTGLNIYRLAVAVIGAVLVLMIYHAVTGRRARRQGSRRTQWPESRGMNHGLDVPHPRINPNEFDPEHNTERLFLIRMK